MVTNYRGWQLKSYHQQAWPPYKQYVCVVSRDINSYTCRWNVEGSSLKQAENIAKERIDNGEVPSFDDFPKLTICKFE